MTLCFSKRQLKPQTHCKHKFTNKIPFHHSSVVCAVMKSKVVPACKVKKKKKKRVLKKKSLLLQCLDHCFISWSVSIFDTWDQVSTSLSCYLPSTHTDLSLCQHPAASHSLSHSLHRGLLTCPSITVWNPRSITTECVRACALARAHLSVIKGWGVETESSCVQFELSGPSADRGLTGLSDDSQLKLSNMSASHIIQHNFTMRLYSDS